jgi:lysozyme
LTYPEAEALLAMDLMRFERGVDDMLKVDVTQSQFDALVSLAFNIGLGNLKGSTLLKKLNAGDDVAAQAQFLVWNRAGGKVMKGLQRRRKAESLVFVGFDADMAIGEAMREHP